MAGYKKTREPLLTNGSLLGGGYLRRPMSLTIVVVTLRALCQEWERGVTLTLCPGNKKTRGDIIADITSLRGRLPTLPLSQYHRRGEA